LWIEGPAGRLEAIREYDPAVSLRANAVVCHPHPQYEGSMENKVVYTLARAAVAAGAMALRFNFRGVGASAGEYGQGRGERDDLRAAETWLETRCPDRPRWRLGFSFGAAIVIAASSESACEALVTVAPPADRLADYGLETAASPRAGRWLLVQGDRDEVVSPAATLKWARSLANPPELAVFKGVGHYFHGELTPLRERVAKMLAADQEDG
jgi:alpha/beta superfamily hydrolase